VARVTHEQAYPGIRFSPRSRNWWAWLKGVPAECEHLEDQGSWMATLIPDTLYVRGKPRKQRQFVRPEVSLCRPCLVGLLVKELAGYGGRVVAFEPDPQLFSQYFFVAVPDFEAAGLLPEVAEAIRRRLEKIPSRCEECSRLASWLWLSRNEVASLDEVAAIDLAQGRELCAAHGAHNFCEALEAIAEANLFYINVPYGEVGAYVWI
jgi:hypothetical protein